MNNQTIQQLIEKMRDYVTESRQQLIEKVLANRTQHITIVLEDIYQPHNASAVIRSCEIFGVQDLHIIENNNQFEPNKGITMGAAKWINLHRHTQSKECLTELKQQGYQIAATSLREDSIPLSELDLTQPTALCFGTEETGLSDEIHQLADKQVYLPMYGFTQSFNISVSAALALNTLTEKLHRSSLPWQLSETARQTLELDWLVKSASNGDALLRHWKAKLAD